MIPLRSRLLRTALFCLAVHSWPAHVDAQLSGVDTAAFDRLVRPQDDFYRYVNGGWLDRNEMPPYMGVWGRATELQLSIYADLSALLHAMAAQPDTLPAEARKLAALYASYMDEAGIDSAGLTQANTERSRIAAMDTPDDVARVLARLIRLGVNVPLSIEIRPDDKQAGRYLADLGQWGLSLPDRNVYLRNDPKSRELLASLRAHVKRFLSLAGDGSAAASADSILALEARIASAQWSDAENRDPVKTYNRTELTALPSLAPGIAWTPFLEGLGLDDAAYINVSQPTYVSRFSDIVQSTPIVTWRAYLEWRLLDQFARMLPRPFVREREAFDLVVGGTTASRPRWLRAIGFVDDAMGGALGRVYVERWFPAQASARADTLMRNLITVFERRLASADWLSSGTRRQAQDKLATLRVKFGHPAKWPDYSALQIEPRDLLGNVLRLRTRAYDMRLAQLGKTVDPTEWGMSPQTVNGYYSALRNEVVLPAALMQPPYFQWHADNAVNYGGLGWYIAHELSHAFDTRGAQYDAQGNLRDWWTPEDREHFSARTKALVAQYAGYEVAPGVFLDGDFTVGENIADNLGLTLAYEAYRLSLGGHPAPVIDGLTGDQRFFISYATIWAGTDRDPIAAGTGRDTHAPRRFRVHGALVNHEAFYDAFNVQAGDRMFVAPEKRVQIW